MYVGADLLLISTLGLSCVLEQTCYLYQHLGCHVCKSRPVTYINTWVVMYVRADLLLASTLELSCM